MNTTQHTQRAVSWVIGEGLNLWHPHFDSDTDGLTASLTSICEEYINTLQTVRLLAYVKNQPAPKTDTCVAMALDIIRARRAEVSPACGLRCRFVYKEQAHPIGGHTVTIPFISLLEIGEINTLLLKMLMRATRLNDSHATTELAQYCFMSNAVYGTSYSLH